MNWRYELTRRDVAGLALVAALVIGIACGYIFLAGKNVKTNWGFGPEWECSNPSGKEPICFKRPPGGGPRPN